MGRSCHLAGCLVAKSRTSIDGRVEADPPHLGGHLVPKEPPRLKGRLAPNLPTQLVGGAKKESGALHSKEKTWARPLTATVAAARPYRHTAILLYCAFLFRCLWMLADRAGLDTQLLRRWSSLLHGLLGRRRFILSENIRTRRMCRAERAVAWRAIMRAADSRQSVRKNRLIGGGEGEVGAPGGHRIRGNPPLVWE